MMRMMRSFDHSGEDNTRKRQYDEALGNSDETHDQNSGSTDNDNELKEGVSKMMDPPARERPAVSKYLCYVFVVCISIYMLIYMVTAIPT